jgi:hypothetical protein
MLEQLRRAGRQPMTLDQLRAGGIDFPAVVIGELELNGYVIERVHEHGKLLGVRLLETEASDLAPATVSACTFRAALRSCTSRSWACSMQARPTFRSTLTTHERVQLRSGRALVPVP